MENTQNLLAEARDIINETDREMAALFVKRMRAAEMVAAYKKERGLPILDAVREKALIDKNLNYIEDDKLKEYYVNFIESVMTVSKNYQEQLMNGLRVAYSGTEGAFAHIASRKAFPASNYVSYPDFPSAYEAVVKGECDIAMLPIENSTNGEVGQVTDLMFSGNLVVNRVLDLSVEQSLLTVKGASVSDIRRVISHPQALGQCTEYIRRHGWEQMEYPNTAFAARHVAELGDKSVAAIGSAEAAEIFGLDCAERGIQTGAGNTTRFAAFSRTENSNVSGKMGSHFILVFSVRNEAGMLAKAIDIIGCYGFNMRTLRSRPMKDLLWNYYFYVEAAGDIKSQAGQEMLRVLGRYCDKLKLVGTYSAEL